MINNNDFEKFALSRGIGSNMLNEYNKYNFKSTYINPTILEERNLNVTALDIFSRLQMDRILFLGTEINADVANILTAQLLWLEQQSDSDIQLYINSPGGEVYSGLQIIDCMDFIKPDVSTTCLGMAASMGAVIFSNGTKGKRYMIPHGRFMIHQPIGGTGRAQASDIEIVATEINKLKNELYSILSNNSNLSFEEISLKSDRDCWLTAKETIDFGFGDKIIEKRQ